MSELAIQGVGVVEPVTLGAIVAALVARALGRAEGRAVDEGEAVLTRLVSVLRRRFSQTDDRAGAEALEHVARAPDSPKLVGELATLLDERADGDPELRGELEALVKEALAAGVDVDAVSQIATGDQIVQSAQVQDSQITVTFATRPDGHGAAGSADE